MALGGNVHEQHGVETVSEAEGEDGWHGRVTALRCLCHASYLTLQRRCNSPRGVQMSRRDAVGEEKQRADSPPARGRFDLWQAPTRVKTDTCATRGR